MLFVGTQKKNAETVYSLLSLFAAPWVKVYLVNGKRCMAKAKTAVARRTLDPLYQQQLVFHEKYFGCVLQVKVLLQIFSLFSLNDEIFFKMLFLMNIRMNSQIRSCEIYTNNLWIPNCWNFWSLKIMKLRRFILWGKLSYF